MHAQQGTNDYCIFYYDNNFCCVSGNDLLGRSDLEPSVCLFFRTPAENGFYITTTEADAAQRKYFYYDAIFGTMELGNASNATTFTIDGNKLKDADGNCLYFYNSHWTMTSSSKSSYYSVAKTEKPLSTDNPIIDGIDNLNHIRTYSYGGSGAKYQCAFDKWKTEKIGLKSYTVYTDPRDFSSNSDHSNADITYSWSLSGIDPQYAVVNTTGDNGEIGIVHYLQSVSETTTATLTLTASATGGWPVAPANATLVTTKQITFEPINSSNTTTEYCVLFNDGWFLSHEGSDNSEMAAREVFNPKTCVFQRTGTDQQIDNTIKTVFNGTVNYLYHSTNNNTNLSLNANSSSFFYVDPNYNGNSDWVCSTNAPDALGYCWRVNYNNISNWWDLNRCYSAHPYHPIEGLDFPSEEILPEITDGETVIFDTGEHAYEGSEALYRSPYIKWLGSYDLDPVSHASERFDIWGILSNATTGDPLPNNTLENAVIDHYGWSLTKADGSDFSGYATVDASTGIINYSHSVMRNTHATLRLTAYVQEGSGQPKAAANVTLYTEMDILFVPYEFTNEGDGSANNPFVIHNEEELIAVRDMNNAGVDFTDTYFVLDDDISLADEENWEPIGNEDHPFHGHFDGDGHAITDMTINTEDDNAGFFGYVTDGEISNLGVTDSDIHSDGSNVGAICGYAENTTFTYCYNNADVEGEENVGGICGYDKGCFFEGCVNTGDVTGEDYVGGISGHSYFSTVTDSYNAGHIDGDHAGGIGYMQGTNTISGCINAGSVTGDDSGPIYAGASSNYSNNYYDVQMCPNENVQEGVTGLLTTQMTGSALEEALGDGWTFTDGMYPRPSDIAHTPTVIAASTPIWLDFEDEENYETIIDVNTPFMVQNDDNLNVTWVHYGTGTALDCSDIENGFVSLAALGYDTIACYINDELYKLIPIVVNNTGSFYRFTGDGDNDNWSNPINWSGDHEDEPDDNDIVIIEDDCVLDVDVTVGKIIIDDPDVTIIVPDGVILDANDIDNNNPDQLIIEDGGQVYTDSDDTYATFHITIEKYTEQTNGWYTIASPMDEPLVQNLKANAFDIYSYDEDNDQKEWQNLRSEDIVIATGVGYLYANSAATGEGSTDLIFKGILTSDRATTQIALSFAATYEPIKGYNLIGNPHAHDIHISDVKIGENAVTEYYRLVNGSVLIQYTTEPIHAGEGFFIKATDNGQNATISLE